MAVMLLMTGIAVRKSRGKTPVSLVAPDVSRQIAQADAMSRILLQQLDEVFDTLVTSIRMRGDLTDHDAAVLNRWKDYDEQFLIATRDNPSLRYMRANACFRLGLINQIQDEHEAAIKHFRKAGSILSALISESPELAGYQGELFFCHLNTAESALILGDNGQASECVAEMTRLLRRRSLMNSADSHKFVNALELLQRRIAAQP